MTTSYPVSPEALPPLSRTAGAYRLRFGRNAADLDGVQRLRFEVFNRELDEGLAESWATGRDADRWDERFHHIVIEHLPSAAIVGSYRLQTGGMADRHGGFYSETEFDLSSVPRWMLREAVEIGRACVQASHRNGRVIHLLWRGLASYLQWNAKRFLFGCCSVPGQDAALGLALWEQLRCEGFAAGSPTVRPQPGMGCDPAGAPLPALGRDELPPLFQSYLNLGAEVCGPPAIDRAFGTLDFLVLLDTERLEQHARRMFFRDLPARALPRIA